MTESDWEAKLKAFVDKTSADMKRFGREAKAEAERLWADAQNPERQQKVKAGLREVGDWAKKTAEDLSGAVDVGWKRAEEALTKAQSAVRDFATAPKAAPPAPKPASAPKKKASPASKPRAAKSIGKKRKA